MIAVIDCVIYSCNGDLLGNIPVGSSKGQSRVINCAFIRITAIESNNNIGGWGVIENNGKGCGTSSLRCSQSCDRGDGHAITNNRSCYGILTETTVIGITCD